MSFGISGASIATGVGTAALGGVVGNMFGSGSSGGGGGGTVTPSQITDQSNLSTGTNDFSVGGGLFDTNFMNGRLNLGPSGQVQDATNQAFGGANQMFNQAQFNPNAAIAGQQGGNFLNQLDPNSMNVQQGLFNQLNPQLQEQFNQQNLAQENRQFAQGRLGSTGGANEMQAMQQAQGNVTNRLLFDSFGQGQQAQNNMFNIGSGLSQLDPSIRNQFAQAGNQFLNPALQFNQQGLSSAQVAGGLAGQNQFGGNVRNIQNEVFDGASSPSFSQGVFNNIGTGLATGGMNQINSGVNNLFSGTPDFTNTNQNVLAGGN